MAASKGSSSLLGVDVCLDEDKLRDAPHCPHGPTLLFERFVGKEADTPEKQEYYACSACRDRKDCDFFQLVGEKVSEARKLARAEDIRSKRPWTNHGEVYQRFTKTLTLKEKERTFCLKCNLLLLPTEIGAHKGHNLTKGLSDSQLKRPSHLLRPIENKKTNAQYLFSDKAVEFFMASIVKFGYDRVLCVGAPRIHEAIQNDSSNGLSSLLLDIDHRYGQFNPPDSFCRYNMFNHYFLDGDSSQEVFDSFLHRNHGDGIVMVTDPPFGGLVEVLASGVTWIMKRWQQGNDGKDDCDLPTMWIFPYFLETRIQQSCPAFHMLDYKVAYDNHPMYTSKKKDMQKGSPVRIFTNVEASKFVLPEEEGYRFCEPCKRYVSAENLHCAPCNACTTKHGPTYRHCELCQRCVKSSFSHCNTCNQCRLQHKPFAACPCVREERKGCHICGEMDHKRRDCPQRGGGQQQQQTQQPRSTTTNQQPPKSKKKTAKRNRQQTNNPNPPKSQKL